MPETANDAAKIAPPEGISADWQAIEGDPAGIEASGTFFAPKTWVIEGDAPNQMARPAAASGVHCFLNMPREFTEDTDPKVQLLKTAKSEANKHAVTDSTIKHYATELYVLEYAAGDGTLAVEAWSVDNPTPSGVTCADESGEKFKDGRKAVDLVIRSFIPYTGKPG